MNSKSEVRVVQPGEERRLTEAEIQNLSERLVRARSESRLALPKIGGVSGAVCGALAVMTLLASDAPWWVIVSFWFILAVVFTVWIGLPQRRLMRDQLGILEDALRANRARVTRIRSERVVEFEEVEDEGAVWAFESGPDETVFIIGQEFYEDDDFPNTDFSIVDVLGTRGQIVDSLMEKHGVKLGPARTIPAAVKDTLILPDHLTLVPVGVDRIESALAPPFAAGGQ